MSRQAHSYDSLAGAARALGEGALLIDEALCLNLRGRQSLCTACHDACAAAALALTPDEIVLDESRCTACGACLPVCPAGAMRLTGFVPRRFVEALVARTSPTPSTAAAAPTSEKSGLKRATAHLHCSRSRDGGGGVVIPCHQVLDARLLAAAAAQGARTFVLHGLDQCGGCERGDAQATVERAAATLAEWLGEAAPEVRAPAVGETEAGTRLRQDQVQLSRRSFLRMAGAQSALSAAQWFAPVAAEDDEEAALLPFYQGDGEFRRPATYQGLLAEHAAELPWRAGALPWYARRIDTRCTGCQTCGTRCPTGALEADEVVVPAPMDRAACRSDFSREEDAAQARPLIADESAPTSTSHVAKVVITFRLDLCTDCGLCETLCPSDAIRPAAVDGPARLAEPRRTLFEHRQVRCTQCGYPFIQPEVSHTPSFAAFAAPTSDQSGPADGAGPLCSTCRNEQDIDADWLAMLGGQS